MRLRAAWLGLVLLAGCEGRIGPYGRDPVAPPPDPSPPSCGGEKLCVGASGLARLTAFEYQQTVRVALGDAALAGASFDALPADGRAGPFISNDDSIANDDVVAQYQLVAENVATAAAAQAEPLLGCALTAPSDACVVGFIEKVGRSLFRVTLSEDDAAPYLTLFRTIAQASGAADGVRVVLEALLQSPRFLYHVRVGTPAVPTREPGDGAVVALDGRELAERLSYLLLGEPPDAELTQAAESGALATAEGLALQTRRLLNDPRADGALGRFHTQWLDLEGLPFRSFAPETYPEVQTLRVALYQETQRFGAYLMRQGDAKLSTLLTASWTVLDPSLAPFYGVSPAPAALSKVELPAGQRSGILTQAGFLAVHTHDPSTQAVQRGKAIRELFLCQGIPPPPPNIDPRITADPSLSPRQRLEAKTSDPSCQGCHALMNPTGFLFEQYEVTGKYRTQVTDTASGLTFPVDAHGEVRNSDLAGPLEGALELGQALSKDEAVHRCVSRQWFRYAVGRHESPDDEDSIEAAYQKYLDSGRDLRELVVAIVSTDAFRYRRLRP